MNNTGKKIPIVLVSLVIMLQVATGCSIIEERFPDMPASPTTPATVTNSSLPPNSNAQEVASWVSAVEKAKPSVVAVETSTGSASGWIIDSEGIIVTNQHVIEGASNIGVLLDDGSFYESVAVYSDPVTDIAVIIIDASGLPAVSIGSFANLQLGQPVAVIGNALGLGISMKGGWVSRLDVSTVIEGRALYGLIETDAAMNPGNSGGPLINLAGEVVGIANAKLVAQAVEGLAYAISIDSALPVIDQLVQDGEIVHPFLGVQGLFTVNQSVAGYYELEATEGVLILGVIPGSGAAAGGLEPGDVLLAINDEPVLTVEKLVQAIRSKQVGQTITVTYDRNGTVSSTSVTLTEPINN